MWTILRALSDFKVWKLIADKNSFRTKRNVYSIRVWHNFYYIICSVVWNVVLKFNLSPFCLRYNSCWWLSNQYYRRWSHQRNHFTLMCILLCICNKVFFLSMISHCFLKTNLHLKLRYNFQQICLRSKKIENKITS